MTQIDRERDRQTERGSEREGESGTKREGERKGQREGLGGGWRGGRGGGRESRNNNRPEKTSVETICMIGLCRRRVRLVQGLLGSERASSFFFL